MTNHSQKEKRKRGLLALILCLAMLLSTLPMTAFAEEDYSTEQGTEQAVEAAGEVESAQEEVGLEEIEGAALQSSAETVHIGFTTASDVNVREEPNTASEIVTCISDSNTQITVHQVVSSDGTIWYQIETQDGQTGYVRADFVEYTMDADEELVIYDAKEAEVNAPAKSPRRVIPSGGVGSYGGPDNVTGYLQAEKFGTGNNKTGDWYLDPDGTLYLKGEFRANGANSSGNAWPWQKSDYLNRETDIKRVVIDGSLQTVGAGDGSLAYMFWACRALESVNLSGFKTVNGNSRTTNFIEMFRGCNALQDIEFGNDFDVTYATNMSGMFWNCNLLTSLDLSAWTGSTSNVTNMSSMFAGMGGLNQLTFPTGWNTGNVTQMGSMFNGCGNGRLQLDMRNWNLQKTTSFTSMFSGSKLASADLSGVIFGTSMSGMFTGARIDTLNLQGANTSNVSNMTGLFQNGRFEHINFDVTQIGTGSGSTPTLPTRNNMFNGAAFKKITFPARYASSGSSNFLSGSGIGSATYCNYPWAKIDDEDNVIQSYTYDSIYGGNGKSNMVGLTGGGLAGTWIMLEEITVQLAKVDEKGNSLSGATFSLIGGYKNSKVSDSEQETNLTASPDIAPADVKVRISGEYELEETAIPQGYMNYNTEPIKFKVKADGTLEIVGSPMGVSANGKTLAVYNYPKDTFAVTKRWDDTERDTRPQTITLRLYDANDTLIDTETVNSIEFSEGNEQTVLFSDDTSGEPLALPHYDNSGKVIKYRVEEAQVQGYVTKIDNSDPEKITIQNISTSKLKDLTVKVRWKEEDGAAGAARPGTVNVTLKQGKLDPATGEYVYTEYTDETITDGVLTLTGSGYNASESYGEWTKTVTGVPIYDENGNEYRYDIEQNTVAEYLTPLKDPEEPIFLTDDDTFTIVNNHKAVITWLRPGAASPFDPSGRRLYQQQTDPDGPGDGITLMKGQDKLYDYVKSNYNPNDAGYFIPAKDAYWTEKNAGENTGTADILISYREEPKNVFFLGSLCNAHNLDSGKLRQELTVAATLSDVDYIAEGVNYLGTTYKYGGTTYSVSGGNLAGTGPFSGTVEQGKRGDALTFSMGAHANVLAFAEDIVKSLSGLSDAKKPAQIILSFDWGAWTACSAALENDDWTEDMKLMRQAASLLQEYYDQGKVIWLASDDNVSGSHLKTFDEMNAVFDSGAGTREVYTNYLYPDNVQDFYDDPAAYTALVNDSYDTTALHRDYRNGTKVSITQSDGSTKEVKPCTTYEFVNYTYTFTGGGTTIRNTTDKAETIDFFTMSKRIPFYQFALLNPGMFLDCTTDTSVTRVPGIDEWLTAYRGGKQWRDTVPTAGYGDVVSVGETLRDNFQGYDTITITDTLVDGLTHKDAEIYYYTGDESKGTSGSWAPVSSQYYTVTCDNGKDVTAVVNAKAAGVLGKRIMLVLHTECDKIIFADINNQPRETNAGNAQVVTTASQVLDDNGQPYVSNEVSIASPRLRKVLPRAQVTAAKTWVDQFGDAWKRPDVVMHLRAKYIDPDTNEAVPSMTKDDILPGILITNGRNQTVIWGAYTEYEGFSVAQYNAKGEGKTLADGKVIVAEGENGLSTKYLDPDTDKTYEIEYEIWESAPDGSDVPGYVLESELDKAETYNDGTDFEYKVVAYKRTANVARTLSVKKIVKNDFAGLHDSFDFTITLTPPEDVDERTITITGGTDVTINGSPGRSFSFSSGGTDGSGDAGGSEIVITCKLAHNETLNIFPLPKGTEYSVSETLNDRYSTTVTHETEDDEKNKTKEIAAYESGVVSGQLVKLAGVTFTNTLISQSELPETGSDEMLRIGLAALAALAGILLVLLMKRRNDP